MNTLSEFKTLNTNEASAYRIAKLHLVTNITNIMYAY